MLSEILPYFPDRLQSLFRRMPPSLTEQLSEIRLRREAPVIAVKGNRSFFADRNGLLQTVPGSAVYRLSSSEFDAVFMAMCDYTLHRVMHTLKEGYLTLPCGARVGVGVRAVYDNGMLTAADDVTSLNVRIPVAADGCSLPLLRALYRRELPSVLIAGAPNSGKTTLLRDMAKQLSSGFNGVYRKVTLVDERGELAGNQRRFCGVNSDGVSGFPKAKGMEIAARTLSPELIIADEIATPQEAAAIETAFASGVRFALSVHAGNTRELLRKPIVSSLLSSGEFGYIVLLRGYTYQYDIWEVTDEADRSDAADCLRHVDGVAAGAENPSETDHLR